MKKFLGVCLILISLSAFLSSCYSHKFTIGDGPQTGVEVNSKNNFFLFGLVPGKVSDPQEMAGGVKDFEVTEVHTFVDGLVGAITFGIYTPTTTKVQK
jgi:hypothetical protein